MSISAQQVVTPPISDPNAVAETYVNGPMNLQVMGTMATITFTSMRPDTKQLFSGNVKDISAIVVSRISMPFESLIQLREMLAQAVQQASTMPGTTGPTWKQ